MQHVERLCLKSNASGHDAAAVARRRRRGALRLLDRHLGLVATTTFEDWLAAHPPRPLQANDDPPAGSAAWYARLDDPEQE